LQGDHKNASAFWAALKVQPIIQSGVQTWKALILVHTWFWTFSHGHRCTRLCRKDTNLHCLSSTRSNADINRREAANQTQWFDGIIRTVWPFVPWHLLTDIVKYGANVRKTDIYLCVLFIGKDTVSSQSPGIQYLFSQTSCLIRVDGLFEYEEYISLKAVEYIAFRNCG